MSTTPEGQDFVGIVGSVYELVTDSVSGIDPRDFLRTTRAEAWSVQDLLFHLLLDAQRALMTFASPTRASADVDAVTYWLPIRPDKGDRGVAHARFVRVASSAYSEPSQLVGHWHDTSTAPVRAAAATDAGGRFETPGHVLELAYLLSTLVVEATIHYVDLTVNLSAVQPPPEALRIVREVLDGLLGQPVAVERSDPEYALKGTGRLGLTEGDKVSLGDQARRLPLLG
ncbi:MAG: maleylpyruvate isomerase N-terminal domain-containing protein [Propionibacteriales bacterium]|nr:maleylpyruvate isomerase N-terminal domain-containing protein [Propionibacteriales bacterium]